MTCRQTEYALDMDVNNMCRICLSQTDAGERLFHIFSSAIVDGFLVAIPDVLQFCVELTVNESDGMPCKICQKCKGQLLGFYLFKQKCQRTHKVLQEALGSSKKQKESTPPPSVTEKSPSVSDDDIMVEILEAEPNDEDTVVEVEPLSDDSAAPVPEAEIQCHLCDQICRTEEHLREHMLDHCTITAEQDQECYADDEQFQEYEDHEEEIDDKSVVVKIHDQEPSESELPVAAGEDDISYSENAKIEKDVSVEPLTNDHTADIQEDTPTTEEDDESIATNIVAENEEVDEVKSIQSDPVSNTDESINQMRCNICWKTIKGRSRYFKHLQTHDVNTNVSEFLTYHICKVCSKVFMQETELLEHINAADHRHHTESLPTDTEASYICGICSAEYIRIDHVKQHLLSHLRSFPCPFTGCGCEYASSARLGLHISSKHIEYETHQCQHCGADSFESMAELQQHLRMKCSGKKFHCDHCDKKFLSSRSLAHHLKCLEKKHRCTECGKTFAQHGELKLHERMHNGERPFKCTVCGKSYKTASLRTAHMDSHIEGKTFQCQLCGKQLQTRTCYRNHIKRHSEERNHECDVCSKKFYTKYNVKVHKQKVHKLIHVKQSNTSDV